MYVKLKGLIRYMLCTVEGTDKIHLRVKRCLFFKYLLIFQMHERCREQKQTSMDDHSREDERFKHDKRWK